MSAIHQQHEATSPNRLRCAVITVSDTRTLENDTGGQSVVEYLQAAGHEIAAREIIPDEPLKMRPLLETLVRRAEIDAILLTGGTGISSRDQTFETVTQFFTKPVPGYGELFRMLSYHDIGPAAMLSRAVGGLIGKVVVLTMPGSPAGVRLAMDKLIVPGLPHLVREARR
jgi:molybdenum cofactor biosynthesis protein B